MCKISNATTFIKFKKYIYNADFELYIEKLQKFDLIRVTKCLIKTYLLVIELLKLSIICKISRATTFIKFKKYVKNADFELYIEKLQKFDPIGITNCLQSDLSIITI